MLGNKRKRKHGIYSGRGAYMRPARVRSAGRKQWWRRYCVDIRTLQRRARARAKPLSYQWRRILVGNFTSPISRNNNIPRLARTSIVCCSASNATRLQCSLEACVWRASQIARARANRPPHSGRAPGHPDTSWVDLSKGVLVVLVVKFRVCWCAAQACTAVHSQPPTPEWSRN